MSTGVVFVQNTSVNGITSFHDKISNEMPKILDPWMFELKMFRTNTIVGKLLEQTREKADLAELMSKKMYLMKFSYMKDETISIVGEDTTIFTGTPVPSLVESGCSTGYADHFDVIVASKLASQWQMLQTLKGEGGNSYELSVLLDGSRESFIVRTANCFLHGIFQGFLVEFTYLGDNNGSEKIEAIVKKMGLPQSRLSLSTLAKDNSKGNLAHQYTQALQI